MSDKDPAAGDGGSTELVEAAARGDKAAIEALMQQHISGVRAFVRLRAGPVVRAKESVSDLVQSACREVLEHIDRFQYAGEAGFRQWLYATALRKVLNRHEYYTAEKRDVKKEIAPPSTAAGGGSSSGAADVGLLAAYKNFATPSQVAIGNEELGRIEQAFDKLQDDYREVIILSRIVGLSRAEIAEKLGKSEASIRGLLYRALAQLAELLDHK